MMMYPHLSQDGQIHLYKCHRRYIHTSHGWSRTGSSCPNDAVSQAHHGEKVNHEDESKVVRSLMSQLCEKFYSKGWMPGTGGGLSMRIGSGTEEDPFTVFSTPSGIQKEDMIGDDVFELDMQQRVITPPITPGLKLSSMTNIWYVVYNLRPSTRCVIHTHSMNSQLATLLFQEHEKLDDEGHEVDVLRLTHLEMIKGAGNHAYNDVLEIPIIDNQTSENLLAPDMERAIKKYPKCNAVLVRRHGVYGKLHKFMFYVVVKARTDPTMKLFRQSVDLTINKLFLYIVWGSSWEEAKTRIESFDYLFETAVKMKQMGLECGIAPSAPSTSSKKRKISENSQ